MQINICLLITLLVIWLSLTQSIKIKVENTMFTLLCDFPGGCGLDDRFVNVKLDENHVSIMNYDVDNLGFTYTNVNNFEFMTAAQCSDGPDWCSSNTWFYVNPSLNQVWCNATKEYSWPTIDCQRIISGFDGTSWFTKSDKMYLKMMMNITYPTVVVLSCSGNFCLFSTKLTIID